jgi:hypothetical protein
MTCLFRVGCWNTQPCHWLVCGNGYRLRVTDAERLAELAARWSHFSRSAGTWVNYTDLTAEFAFDLASRGVNLVRFFQHDLLFAVRERWSFTGHDSQYLMVLSSFI